MADPVFPQRPTVANAEVLSVEWLFEPLWPGERLMARIDGRSPNASGQMMTAACAPVAG